MIHVWDVLGDQLIDAARLGDLTVVRNILDGGQVPVDFVQAVRVLCLGELISIGPMDCSIFRCS